ncbi:MAG TPA: porin family protein, partial [Geobacteraceae bacterium]
MNKTLHTLLFLATLLVTVTTGVASAQNKAETFNLTPFIGGYVFDGKQHLEHRPTFGLRGGYNFTDRIGVEGVFGFVNTEPTEGHSTGNDDMDVFNYRLEALYHFFPESRLVPYLAAGYGVIATDRDNSKRDTRGAFNYGLGAKYFLTDNLALRGDVRHLI